jgi:hypothetical protein
MTTGGLGYTDIGNKFAITGISRDFYRRIGAHYGKFEQWTFEPKVAEALFQDYVKRGGFKVLYDTRLKEVEKNGNVLTAIILENTDYPQRPAIIIKAKMFIDCGYEGDLMAKAGVQFRVGREDNKEYNETINGVQLKEGHQFPDGIDPYKIPGKPESGLLWGISSETLLPEGTGDNKVQTYNYRICLSSDPKNQIPITRPEGYDSTTYELLLRLFAATPQKRKLNDYFAMDRMPNNKTDINNRGGFSSDMIGMNYGYPEGDYDERKKIIKDHELYTKGLLYFYGHDPRVPVQLREEMLKYGYPKDEYPENGNWSPQLYIREARRMVGQYVMTQANCQGKETVNDGIGLAAYTMDSHNCERIVLNGQVKNEGNVEVGGFGPYPISYGAIIPKESQAVNLFVPVALSATHIAYGSIRMEPVFMVLAQSSATAAVLAVDAKQTVQQVDIPKLKQQLKENPLADGSVPDVLVDNEDQAHIAMSGDWMSEKKGGYGSTFLVNASKDNTARVRFTPDVSAGQYNVYIYIPKVEGSTSKMLIKVSDGKHSKEVIINPASIIIEGQTSGEWVSLGSYIVSKGAKPFVEVSTKNANGKVIADAVIWVSNGKKNK